jgi:predicted outer membrane repeat protein
MSIATRQLRRLCCPIIACLVPTVLVPAAHGQPQQPVVIYVDGELSANGDGQDWTTAFKYLQNALLEASDHADQQNPYQIWVAATDAGNPYRPDRSADNPQGTGDRDDTFALHDYVAVYGGFVHGDDDLADRDPAVNETVLSGDIGAPGVATDNSLHVVTALNVGASAILDGFTISDGYGQGVSSGAGIVIVSQSDPKLAGPVIVRCALTNNWAPGDGGAVSIAGPFADPTLVDCSFVANAAHEGGAMEWENGTQGATLVNCLFIDNTATLHGGAIDSGGDVDIVNCTFVGNTAPAEGGGVGGGAIWAEWDQTTITNCIFWGNIPDQIQEDSGGGGGVAIVTYSDVQGEEWTGMGNVDADPRFVDAEAGDFRLAKPCSPCVDAGHPDDGGSVNSSCPVPGDYSVPCALTCPLPPGTGSGIPCDDPWDVDQDGSTGEPTPDLRFPSYPNSLDRVLDGEGDDIDDPRIDMGAYEFVRKCCPWDCQTNVPPDGEVGPDDANSLRLQYGQECTTCDFGVGLPWVDDNDWFALVAHWGPCDCDVAQQAQADGPAFQLTLEDALWIQGFDSVDDYLAWGYQATEPQVYASMVILLAFFGY